MTKGYYLVIQDKTTCGGIIIEGEPTHTIIGKAVAREQDRVTCVQHPGMYIIVGHIPGDSILGRKFAGTLHSYSSCPCKARFIPSQMNDTYELQGGPTAAEAPVPVAEPEQHAQSAKVPEKVTTRNEPKILHREPVEPGFCVLPYGATAEAFEPWLFMSAPPEGAKELYHSLNGSEQFKAGSILLLVDPLKQNSEQIIHMKTAKARIDTALAPLTPQEASFLHRNKDTIDLFTSHTSLYGGVAADAAGKYFEKVEIILAKIQATYKNQYITSGTLIGEQFFVERRKLFKELDGVLTDFTKYKIGLKDYPDIRRSLGLSSSAITHRWNQTGVSDIEGYATYMENAAKYVKLMKKAGYVGIVLDGVNRLDKVYEACTVGSDCAKTSFTEVGSFSGAVLAPIYTAPAVASASTAVCAVVLGALTAEVGGAGALACGVIVSGAAGYGISELGGKGGELLGETIYEVTK
ncbi:PAAR domain-containing protein [Rahnella sp. PD12R]|uniref:PAAR domain-containing protein n=1 Tax=Rahnella sp. PD12R TaxID=2855688 RepID=UPI001C44EBDC|nr:PAAR domain-containing protein [Rahnella sp. PD12R]MBV6816895.1 PAAR domain-containing protein [Rahnella sp. PD12R]